ncbi:MAG TPA: hypothetical protein VN283_08165 [Thiobacillus sp.]|nr:hypothetical protein [Thiobacillus sp.]
MGIFDKLFGRRSTEELAERLIERSREIVSAYGAILETGPVPGTVADTSELPYPKDAIKIALVTLLTLTKEPSLREHLKLGYVSLADWQTGVGPSRVGIDATKLDVSLEPVELANRILAGDAAAKEWLPRARLEQEALIAELRELGHW